MKLKEFKFVISEHWNSIFLRILLIFIGFYPASMVLYFYFYMDNFHIKSNVFCFSKIMLVIFSALSGVVYIPTFIIFHREIINYIKNIFKYNK